MDPKHTHTHTHNLTLFHQSEKVFHRETVGQVSGPSLIVSASLDRDSCKTSPFPHEMHGEAFHPGQQYELLPGRQAKREAFVLSNCSPFSHLLPSLLGLRSWLGSLLSPC